MKEGSIELYKFEKKIYQVSTYKNYCEVRDKDQQYSLDIAHSRNGRFHIDKFYETEEAFVENFANPFASVLRQNKTIVVEKIGDKISIKVFLTSKTRELSKVYFRESRRCHFVTYNIKTNDLYDGFIHNYHLKRNKKKSLRRNQFWRQPLQNIADLIRGVINESVKKPLDVIKEIEDIFNVFINNIPNAEKSFLYSPDDVLFKTRANIMGVKLPDNWQVFSKMYPTPTKKLLKKHNFKFIDALQSYYGLSGGKFKKIFHQLDYINTQSLVFIVAYFGPNFIRTQSAEDLKQVIDFSEKWNYVYLLERLNEANLSELEKNNFWKMYILACGDNINLSTIIDHIDLICKLRRHGEDVKFKAKTLTEFRVEHADFSILLESYRKGICYRFYNDKFTERVQQPIFVREYYYPVLLTSTVEYNEESSHQSNCVRGYVDKVASIIISLRKGDEFSKERATIEYGINARTGKLSLTNVQSLGRFNSKLSSEWEKVVRHLDERMTILGSSNVFTLPEMVTKFKNKELYQKAVIEPKGNVSWDNETENTLYDDLFEMPI